MYCIIHLQQLIIVDHWFDPAEALHPVVRSNEVTVIWLWSLWSRFSHPLSLVERVCVVRTLFRFILHRHVDSELSGIGGWDRVFVKFNFCKACDLRPCIAKREVILENAINTRLGFNEVWGYSIMISHFYCKILRIFIGKEWAPFNYKNAKIYHPCDLVHLQFVHNYLCFSSNYSTSV